jgi:hypothetical protein
MDDGSCVVRNTGDGQGQQLGRTKDRERRGSTGRAGRSKAGDRLAGCFFIHIHILLRWCRVSHHRHQPDRYRDKIIVY